MKSLLIILLIVLAVIRVSYGQNPQPQASPATTTATQAEKEEWEKIQKRFKEYHQQMGGLLWTLTHTYYSKEEMDKSFAVVLPLTAELGSKDPVSVRKFNGPKGFKQQLVELMPSKEGAVSSFAARVLGIVGDQSYAPQIALLLDRYDPNARENVVAGQAAIALAMLDARQYTPRIVLLLKSESHHDRIGAAWALGLLKATEYANDVVRLLKLEDYRSTDDDSPILVLFEMGVAGNYEKEIAEALNDDYPNKRVITAAYALARLKAIEHAPAIANLLKYEFHKGDGAKVLALLGAKQYTNSIARMLTDKRAYNREDAALALGVLDAREHKTAIARLLKDKNYSVRMAAAQALVLMEATGYRQKVLPIIAEQLAGDYLNAEDFHSLVTDEAAQLNTRLKVLLARMKEFSSRPPASRP